MKIISIYTKTGARAATSYYRVYQYLKGVDAVIKKRKMLSDGLYKRLMPISRQPIHIKIFTFLIIYIRVLSQLARDSICPPACLIISRRLINRIMPLLYKFLLKRIKQSGTKIIWDFDDEIIESKEVSRKTFDFLSEIADVIIVASPYNKAMVGVENSHKVQILPTTDGDMFKYFNYDVVEKRALVLDKQVRIIWLGTSVSLKYVLKICDKFEILAKKLEQSVVLTIVSDKSLNYIPLNFKLRNIQWSRDVALQEALNSHLGIMPLDVNSFTKGKGGFKLIQYLSVGLPVVATGVGINNDIVSSDVGKLVDNLESMDWCNAIYDIIKNKNLWINYSKNAFYKWSENYNYSKNLKIWNSLLMN